MRFRFPPTAFVLSGLLLLATPPVAPAQEKLLPGKPVFLYSRCFNAEGETRYLPEGSFKQILSHLREHFDVRVHAQPLTSETLEGVNLVLIANPSDQAVAGRPSPRHFRPADIEVLTSFVHEGGGLILLGNQENHNLEVADSNKLLGRFGLQWTNLHTDAKKLVLPRGTPMIGGLSWAYYTGNLLTVQSNHPARPLALVTNDLAQKPLKGERDQAGTLLAVAKPGRGFVMVATDAGWLTDDALQGKGIGGVAITGHDNWEIFKRLVLWSSNADEGAARSRPRKQ